MAGKHIRFKVGIFLSVILYLAALLESVYGLPASQRRPAAGISVRVPILGFVTSMCSSPAAAQA